MSKEIDLEKIYEAQRMDDFNNMNLSDEEIVWVAMKEAIRQALEIASETQLEYFWKNFDRSIQDKQSILNVIKLVK